MLRHGVPGTLRPKTRRGWGMETHRSSTGCLANYARRGPSALFRGRTPSQARNEEASELGQTMTMKPYVLCGTP